MNVIRKNQILETLAHLIAQNAQQIITVNKKDVAACSKDDPSIYDRLIVDNNKVKGMVSAIRDVIGEEDPTGKVLYQYTHPNGLEIENRVVPFGKILIIYESRPDVTIEAAISAFKSGNKVLLKGGKEARNTNLFLVDLWHQALKAHGENTSWVKYLDLPREEVQKLIRNELEKIDLIIPRGGEGLIRYVKTNSDAPVIVSGRGNNFLYVDSSANIEMAVNIILNGKKRISVCNALDKVLFDKNIEGLPEVIIKTVNVLLENNIEVFSDTSICKIDDRVKLMPDESMYLEEFLDAKIMLSMVASMEEVVEKINIYSGGHSATIVTSDRDRAHRFQEEVDCAAVYHNASTRFTDGGQFGFGAEMAISTQKLHFRGPIGVGQLVSNKWFISGNGQVRE